MPDPLVEFSCSAEAHSTCKDPYMQAALRLARSTCANSNFSPVLNQIVQINRLNRRYGRVDSQERQSFSAWEYTRRLTLLECRENTLSVYGEDG